MKPVCFDAIPNALAIMPQWVLWRITPRDGKPTKVPYQVNGSEAKSNTQSTWSTFAEARKAYHLGGYDGVGFVFAADGGVCGVDLDGCRDPKTGTFAPWAESIITRFGTYSEISPSETGIKLFCENNSVFDRGTKKDLKGFDRVCEKAPAIEVYDRLRYFAVTGWKYGRGTLRNCREELAWLKETYWKDHSEATADWYGDDAVLERARKYLAKLPPSISGQSGHNAAFHAACTLVLGFGLTRPATMVLMREWNQTCQPPWSEHELSHKVDSAAKQTGPRNYLRNVQTVKWDSAPVPTYTEPRSGPPKREMIQTTLADAAREYLEKIGDGRENLITSTIPDLDRAVGGGFASGELVLVGARPSHGKSAFALQCAHGWTAVGMPTLLISEEMSPMALGKRTLQFVSDEPHESWQHRVERVKKELADYAAGRSPCIIVENCRTASVACEQIDRAVEQHKIQAVIIDYAQLLTGRGNNRYEEVTNASIAIRQAANKHKVVILLLCQFNREIEKRNVFAPVLSDFRETGQFEQDADVAMGIVWPHRIDQTRNADEFQFFILKNRNRPIVSAAVHCVFKPSRQMIVPKPAVSTDWRDDSF